MKLILFDVFPSEYRVYCVKSPFTLIVIPGLTEPAPYLMRGNPVFPSWIPAGVYPVLDTGLE